MKLPLKVIGYKGFVQDISPEGGAIVIPPEEVTDYEDAISEVKEAYLIEAEIKGVLAMVTDEKLDLNLVISSFDRLSGRTVPPAFRTQTFGRNWISSVGGMTCQSFAQAPDSAKAVAPPLAPKPNSQG